MRLAGEAWQVEPAGVMTFNFNKWGSTLNFDVEKIMELLPHRYPFLLVDRVTEVEPGVSLSAIKNVTINEPFFQGHFPGKPIMPGVLILEAMAQATGLLAFRV